MIGLYVIFSVYPAYHFKFYTCCCPFHNSVTFFVVLSFICKNAGRTIYENLFFLHSTIKSEMFFINSVIVLSELSVKHGLIVFILYSTVISKDEY